MTTIPNWILPPSYTEGFTQDMSGLASHDFTIPSAVNKIFIFYNSININAGTRHQLQLGDSGGVEVSGYKGSSQTVGSGVSDLLSSSFILCATGGAENVSGMFTLVRATGNLWSISGTIGRETNATQGICGGVKELSSELTTLRVTTTSSPTTITSGSIIVNWE